ncbi:FecR domain-containing protein [uncultured Bacteroides sp.]|uniref:FecR family protein n=1 Tax=uncultured Bacteroides sp. TaxID=162156 RepID=UPI0026329EE6|nr:FecR domain-containing protein [uncultured Bacteroides sp.]
MRLEEHTDMDLLITRYLSGKMDKESFAELKRRSLESESNRKYVRNKLEVWFSSGVANTVVQFDKDKAFSLFKQRVAESEKRRKRALRFSWKTFMRVAAVALVLIIPFAAYWQGKQAVKQNFADMIVEAPMGAHTKLYLPDGTLVWLNAGSKIVYSQGFGVDDRRLRLEGEGYFEVTKNEELPFRIKTEELSLQVLGTKFNFRNYPDDEEVTVNLLEGKVDLQNGVREMPELYLIANEKMVLNKVTGQMVKSCTRADKANVWINDELFFDEELLEDIAKKLMRSYNVKIEVADSLRDKRFYGSFGISGNTIDKILDVMVSTRQMNYKIENGVYILY